jgi:hypothetical protein
MAHWQTSAQSSSSVVSRDPHAGLRQRPISVDEYFSMDSSCLYQRTGDEDHLRALGDVPPPSYAVPIADHRNRLRREAEEELAVQQAEAFDASRRHATNSWNSRSYDEPESPSAIGAARDRILSNRIDDLATRRWEVETLAAVGGDPLLHEMVQHASTLPLHAQPQHLIRPKRSASQTQGYQDVARLTRPVQAAALRPNVARAKWGPVTFGNAQTVQFRDNLDAEIHAIREAFAAKSTIVTFPEQVADEALHYAPSRFGTEWEMFDPRKHSDFEAKERLVREEGQRRKQKEEQAETGVTTAADWIRFAEEHDRASRMAGYYDAPGTTTSEGAWGGLVGEPSEAVKKFRAQRPEWLKRAKKRDDEARGEGDPITEPGVTPKDVTPLKHGALPGTKKLESIAKPFRLGFHPSPQRAAQFGFDDDAAPAAQPHPTADDHDAAHGHQHPAHYHSGAPIMLSNEEVHGQGEVVPLSERRVEPAAPTVVRFGDLPSERLAREQRVRKIVFKAEDEDDDVTLTTRRPPPFRPRANPPRYRTGMEVVTEAPKQVKPLWGTPAAAGTDKKHSTAGNVASPTRALALKVSSGGHEAALTAFFDMAQRPPERRTHTSAILPFFTCGVDGFDPVLAKDRQSLTYKQLFELDDEAVPSPLMPGPAGSFSQAPTDWGAPPTPSASAR